MSKVDNRTFKINYYLSLKLELDQYTKKLQTEIYVKNRKFMQCKRLILNIPKRFVYEFADIDSIDEAFVKNESIWLREVFGNPDMKVQITPEEEFRGHCSNIQAWAENDYDTRLLHSNLSFPLLRALSRAGDPKAKKVCKEEIADRFIYGNETVRKFLLNEQYLYVLNKIELQTLADETYSLLSGTLKRQFNTVLRRKDLRYALRLSRQKMLRLILEGKHNYDWGAFHYVKFLRSFRFDQLVSLKESPNFKPPNQKKFDRIYEEKKLHYENFVSKFKTLDKWF